MQTVRLDDGLHRTTLPNGLTVLTERLPGVAIGGRWGVGSYRQCP